MPGVPSNELRRNPLTGRWVTIASGRASRPQDFVTRRLEVEPVSGRVCPFCPGNEEETPPALETVGGDGSWQVRVVPNRYPAFDGHAPMAVESHSPLHRVAAASGRHEVLVTSPRHDASLADLDDDQVALVMRAFSDRMRVHATLDEVAYTQAIVNYGREAGASLEHPHAQLLGIPFVPGEIEDEYRGFSEHTDTCVLCDTAELERSVQARVVLDDDEVTVVAPWWSGVPYEMLVIPRSHTAHLVDAHRRDIDAVGRALRDAIVLLHRVLGDVAYNVVVHTAPYQALGAYHWHVHLLPRTSTIAGFEQGTGVLINTMVPETAASQLRGAARD
ncbi:MAG: galactose-1-phosphate uridylyltransferase [Acidimicrobiales bacterium]